MGKFIDGGLVPEDDPMFNGGSWMVFSIRRPTLEAKPLPEPVVDPVIAQRKTYFILINPDSLPREAGYLGVVISRHYTKVAALTAQERVHRKACEPITTSIYSHGRMPRVTEYLDAECVKHVRTILKCEPARRQ